MLFLREDAGQGIMTITGWKAGGKLAASFDIAIGEQHKIQLQANASS